MSRPKVTPKPKAKRTPKPKPYPVHVFQDADGNWKGVRRVSTSIFEHRILIKRSQDCFADAKRGDEARRLADEWAKEATT